MPANLTPEYKKADEWFRSASTDAEKLLALEEMLRTIPKHKGTEHMRADLRRRVSKLKEAAAGGKSKGGSKGVDIFHVPRSGAGQVVLIGTPNCGKSSIVGAVSKAKVNITDYPFATDKPVPGMAMHEDVPIQLVDMPPVTADYAPPGCVSTYRSCDLIAIVIDLTGDVLDEMEVCLNFLESHRLLADEQAGSVGEGANRLGIRGFVICTKADITEVGTTEVLKELYGGRFEFIEISSQSPEDLTSLNGRIFEMLDVVRVYAKKPGKEADMKDPFTLCRGSTVLDLAKLIHRELAEKLKSARAWGTGVHDGQNVHRTHELIDKDIIELHFS